jgi:hypothetical protein
MNLEYYAINRQSSHLEGAVSLPCLVGQDVEHMEYFVTHVQAKTADERLTDQHKDCFVKKGIVRLCSIHTLEENSCLDYI